jgi:hypothetical protein
VAVDRYAPGLISHAVSSRRAHMGWRGEIRERIAELEQQRLRLEEQRRRARRLGSETRFSIRFEHQTRPKLAAAILSGYSL